MKKLLLFAAALLCLVACNDKGPEAPGRQVTISATVSFNDNNAAIRKVAPDVSSLSTATATFHWEEGDQVMLVSSDGKEKQLFTIDNKSINGTKANFTGTALTDMSSYMVFYAGKNISAELVGNLLNSQPIELTNATNGYNILAACEEGGEDGFVLDTYYNTLRLRLTGDGITLGAIKFFNNNDKVNPCTTINFGTSGLALTSTAQEVWVPTSTTMDGLNFSFYDTDGELIMEKAKADWSWSGGGSYDFNRLITLPELEVKAASRYLHLTTAAFSGSYLAADKTAMETILSNLDFSFVSDYTYYVDGTTGQTDFNNAEIYSEQVQAMAGQGVQYICYVKPGEGDDLVIQYTEAFGGDPVVFGSLSLPMKTGKGARPAAASWADYKAALPSYDLTSNAFAVWVVSISKYDDMVYSIEIERIDATKEKVTIFLNQSSW